MPIHIDCKSFQKESIQQLGISKRGMSYTEYMELWITARSYISDTFTIPKIKVHHQEKRQLIIK